MKPDVKSSGEKKDTDDQKPKFNEYIISAPKPQEAIQRPRLYTVHGVFGDTKVQLMVKLYFIIAEP